MCIVEQSFVYDPKYSRLICTQFTQFSNSVVLQKDEIITGDLISVSIISPSVSSSVRLMQGHVLYGHILLAHPSDHLALDIKFKPRCYAQAV